MPTSDPVRTVPNGPAIATRAAPDIARTLSESLSSESFDLGAALRFEAGSFLGAGEHDGYLWTAEEPIDGRSASETAENESLYDDEEEVEGFEEASDDVDMDGVAADGPQCDAPEWPVEADSRSSTSSTVAIRTLNTTGA